MKICLTIQPSSMKDALTSLNHLKRSGEPVEVRTDNISDLNMARLLSAPRPEVIITNRRITDGGYFGGTDAEHLSILLDAAEHGAEYIDIELQSWKKLSGKIGPHKISTKMICSYHNFLKIPNNLSGIYKKIKSLKPDIIKIAVMCHDIRDNNKLFKILTRARDDNIRIIGICMGKYGEISRILGGKFGAYLTYAPLTENACSGPGQIAADKMKALFRAHKINRNTKIFGLIGNPVKFSKGIYFHNRLFSNHGLNAVYVNFLVDDLSKFLSSSLSYTSGFSVTMPFKQEIVEFIGSIDENVRGLGIINTVIKRNNRLMGYNSDLTAILILLKRIHIGKLSTVTILGTGSMARTIAFACNHFHVKCRIVGRNKNRAKIIADEFGYDYLAYGELNNLGTDILINATSVGMGNSSKMPPVSVSLLKTKPLVMDVVANPPQTRLITEARKRGCKTITGDKLFSLQAKIQSDLFKECCR